MLYKAKNGKLEVIAGTTVASGDTSPIGTTMLFDGDTVPTGWQEVEEVYSNPNLLINGDFQIWQRGEIFSACQNDKYYPDRWQYFADNITSCTMKKVEEGISFISTKNEGGWAIIYQPLETELFNKLKGKTVTQSWLENGVQFEKTFTIPEIWARDIVNIPIARTDSTIIQNVKLELGSIATPFVPRHYTEELVLCKRYFQIVNIAETNPYYNNRQYTGVDLTVEMRAQPTRVYTSLFEVNKDITSDINVIYINKWHAGIIVFNNPHVVMRGAIHLDAEIY